MSEKAQKISIKETERVRTLGSVPESEGHIGFDPADRWSILATPAELLDRAEECMLAANDALFEEGSRGPAMKRMLAREISLRRLALRRADLALAMEESALLRGQESDLKRLRVLEQLVSGEHARLLATIAEYDRLTTVSSPRFSVYSDQTAIMVGGDQ